MTPTGNPAGLRTLLRSGVGIAVAMAMQNLATYAFTIMAARRLGPAEYGAVAGLMGLLLVVFVVSLGLQATGARMIAAEPARRAEIEAALMSVTYRSALVLGALCLLLTPVISWGLRLDDWPAALMIGLSAVPLTIMGGQSGVLQGERRWGGLGGIYLGMGLGRLVVGGVTLLLVPNAFGAMLGVAIGAWVPAVIGALALGHVGRGAAARQTVARTGERILREVGANSHALLAFFALSNADVVVARVTLDAHSAGLYAGGLILSKAVLFLPQFVVVLAFPSMAARGREQMYLKGLLVIAVIGVAASVGAAVLSDLAVIFVGGRAYEGIEPLVGLFAALGTLLALVQLMVYEVVARQHRASVWVLWGGLLAVAAIGAYVGSVRTLLLGVAAVDLVVLAVLLGTALVGSRRRAPSAQ